MPQIQKYPVGWRVLHWLMALMVFALIPIGIIMAERAEAEIWGALTNTLYNWHKAIGFSVLLLMILRIVIKVWL
ncbi:MAG: cytochrome b/b6 domain-containing protein, partial [Pseudohongiellaceae bacterium]